MKQFADVGAGPVPARLPQTTRQLQAPCRRIKGQDIADTERRSSVRAGTGPAPTPPYSSVWLANDGYIILNTLLRKCVALNFLVS